MYVKVYALLHDLQHTVSIWYSYSYRGLYMYQCAKHEIMKIMKIHENPRNPP